jgi:hypothetical protein
MPVLERCKSSADRGRGGIISQQPAVSQRDPASWGFARRTVILLLFDTTVPDIHENRSNHPKGLAAGAASVLLVGRRDWTWAVSAALDDLSPALMPARSTSRGATTV